MVLSIFNTSIFGKPFLHYIYTTPVYF